MGSTVSGPFDPTSTALQDTQLANSVSGCIFIHNLSQYELTVTTPDKLLTIFVAAWGWRRIDVKEPMPRISWAIVATPTQTNPPLSAVFVESFELREEAPPQYFGTYVRQTSVGSTLSTTQLVPMNDTVHFLTLLWDAVNHQLDIEPNNTAQTGSLAIGWALFAMDPSGIGRQVLSVNPAVIPPSLTLNGQLAGVAGEAAAAGSLGVAVVDALTQAQHVTVTTQVTILSFTPATTGTYRISCYARIVNGISPNNVKFQCLFNDPDAVGATTISLLSALTGGFMTGANSVANGGHPTVPIEVRHTGGQVLSVIYQDPTNTPADFVTAHVERIA